MRQWAIYTSDGRIDRIYSGTAEEALLQPQQNEALALLPEGLNDTTAYVVNGAVEPKAPMPLQMTSPQIAADGLDECLIGNIPPGTMVTWPDGQVDTVTDGEVRFSVDLPGTYTLRFSAIPYLDKEVTLEAVAAA